MELRRRCRLRGRRFQRRWKARPAPCRDGPLAGPLRERDPRGQLAGARSPRPARAGPDQPVTQQYVVGTPAGATAMPALRVHGGIGHHRSVDWLRIQWPDSLLQAELEMAGNQVVTLPETCRRTSSCPHLFAWNGQNFAFIS